MNDKQMNEAKLLTYLESLQATDLPTVHQAFCLAYYLGTLQQMDIFSLVDFMSQASVDKIVEKVGNEMRGRALYVRTKLQAKEVDGG